MGWKIISGLEIAKKGMITEFHKIQQWRKLVFSFVKWKFKIKLKRHLKQIQKKRHNRYLYYSFKEFHKNLISNKNKIIEWNNISKKLKYWIFEKIYETLKIPYQYDIVRDIIELYMKPQLKYDNQNIKGIHRKRLGEYIWKPNIFEKNIFSNREIKCIVHDKHYVIPFKRTYYSFGCHCNTNNYCKKCLKKHFFKDDKIQKNRKCNNCNLKIDPNYIYQHRSGFSRFDLSKLYFNIHWREYYLNIELYDINKNYKDNKNIIYRIKLTLVDWGCVYNNVSIPRLCNYIKFLQWYYRERLYKEIIIFSKFYDLLNEILEYIYIEPKIILKKNHSYKNPKKTLELYLIMDSLNKYLK